MRKLIAFLLLLSFCSADLRAGHYLIIKSNGGPEGYAMKTEKMIARGGNDFDYTLVLLEPGTKSSKEKIIHESTFTSVSGKEYLIREVLVQIQRKLSALDGDGQLAESLDEDLYYTAERKGKSDVIHIYTGKDAISHKLMLERTGH